MPLDLTPPRPVPDSADARVDATTPGWTWRANLAWIGLLVVAFAVSVAAITALGQRGQDIVGVVVLAVLAAVTIGGRMRWGHGHRPRLRDGANTTLVAIAWVVAVLAHQRAGVELTVALASAAVSAAFAVAAVAAGLVPPGLRAPVHRH